MYNLRKFLVIICALTVFSCTDKTEPLFDTVYTYNNAFDTKVSIEFYIKNSEKKSLDIVDSISIRQYNINNTFGPEYNDSIIVVFSDQKKVVFKSQDNQSPYWSLNATNTYAYKRSEFIRDNLTTYVYTYIIDNSIYDLAE